MLKKIILTLLGLSILIIITQGNENSKEIMTLSKQFYRYVPQINDAYSVTQQIYPDAEKRFKQVQKHDFFIQQVKKSLRTPGVIMSHTFIDNAPGQESNQFHRQNQSLKKDKKITQNSYQKRSVLFYILLVDGILLVLVIGLIICYCKTNKLDWLDKKLRKKQLVRVEQLNSLCGQINNQNSSNPVKRQSEQSSSQEDIDGNNSD